MRRLPGSRDRDAAEQLARLLEGSEDGDVPDELARLASLATTLREHSRVPAPHPAVRDRIRTAVLEDVRATELTWWERTRAAVLERTATVRNSAKVAVASGLASTMLGTAALAAASQEALPGDVLYGLKQLTESVRMTLAGGDVETGRLHLDLARERLEEIAAGLGRLSDDELVTALEAMDRAAVEGADHLLAAFERLGDADLLALLESFTAGQRELLSELFPDLPASVAPFAEQSLEVLRRIDTQAGLTADDCRCEEDAAPVAGDGDAEAVPLPGEGPAVEPRCDCAEEREPAPPRESRSEAAPDEGQAGSEDTATDDGAADDGDPLGDVGDQPIDGLEDPLGDEPLGDKPLGDQPLDDEPLGDEPLSDEPLDDATDDPTDELGDVAEGTGDTVGDVTDGTTDVVEEATETIDDLLG